MIDIIVCATQRSGSTMILEDMRNCGVLGNPEEWFITWNMREQEGGWRDRLERITNTATGENGISSVKLMANQLMDFDDCVSTFSPVESDRLCGATAAIFAGASWVHVKRFDVIAQAVSRIMAQQTGLYHATGHADDTHFAGSLLKGYTRDYNDLAIYRYESILQEITAIGLENLAWQGFFEAHGISPLVLNYEEVAGDAAMAHLDALADLVGLPDSGDKRDRKMVKMGNERSLEWRERFLQDAARSRFRRPQPAGPAHRKQAA